MPSSIPLEASWPGERLIIGPPSPTAIRPGSTAPQGFKTDSTRSGFLGKQTERKRKRLSPLPPRWAHSHPQEACFIRPIGPAVPTSGHLAQGGLLTVESSYHQARLQVAS